MPAHIIRGFLSWWGLATLAALDTSVVFTFPIALDVVVVAMSSIHRDWFWLCPIVATAGSLTGAASSLYLGRIMGEQGLARFVSDKYLARIKARLSSPRAAALALVPLMPPPFPLTAVIVAAGAFKARTSRVLGEMGAGLIVRFSLESCLALVYGRRIVHWINSTIARDIAVTMIVIMIAGSGYSIWRLIRTERLARGSAVR